MTPRIRCSSVLRPGTAQAIEEAALLARCLADDPDEPARALEQMRVTMPVAADLLVTNSWIYVRYVAPVAGRHGTDVLDL